MSLGVETAQTRYHSEYPLSDNHQEHCSVREDAAEPQDPQSNIAHREDVPPDGGYGWICTISVLLINANTWGVNFSWGVFLAHFLSDSSFPHATQLDYGLIGGLSISQALLVSPLVALSNEKLGTKFSLWVGVFLTSASLFASGFATQTWHLFLSQGACFGYGLGFLYLTASNILPQWFSTKRSLAVGIATSGAGIGGIAYNLGAGAGIESLGVRWTWIILAICTLAMNAVCALLLRDRNKFVRPSTGVLDLKEFIRLETQLIILWGFLTELGYIVILYSLPTFAMSIGLSAKQGSIVGAVLNVGLAIGRPAVGYWSDRFGRINVAGAMTAICGVLCLAIWVPARSYATLLLFALLSGTVTGTFWACVVPVATEVVGLRRLPLTFTAVVLPLVLPTTFAEPIALSLVSTSGYLSAQVFAGCMFLAGAISVLALRAWKVNEIRGANGHFHATGMRKIQHHLYGLFTTQKV